MICVSTIKYIYKISVCELSFFRLFLLFSILNIYMHAHKLIDKLLLRSKKSSACVPALSEDGFKN